MKSIIEEIFNSKRWNSAKIKPSQKYLKALSKYQECCEKLEKSLNIKQKQIFDELLDTIIVQEGETACTHFKEGFKFGVQITFEGLGD